MDPISTATLSVATKIASSVAPKLLDKCKEQLFELGAELHHALVGAFVDSIRQTYDKHSYFSSIIFPNRQMRLEDYYLPLTLNSTSSKGESSAISIDAYPGDLLTSKKDILVVDSAGMGKSTILKYIFLKSVECNAGIPVFIELRKLSKPGQSITQNIIEQLESCHDKINEKLVKKLISNGGFIFFFDGYDEISDDTRSAVTADIIEFKRRANNNIYLLSSREMPGLNAFKEFYRYNIKPLEIAEAYSLIRLYSESESIANDLIVKLELESSKPIKEFLRNPLLVSLLYKAYEFKKAIPLKKHVFYRQVFEALFENHDLSKDSGELNRRKKTGLDIHSFEIVMRAVGYETLKTSKVEYNKDELILILEAAQKPCIPIKFSPQALLDDLTVAVPLFAVDGANIRWQHKSLQEYFSALYVSAAGPEFQAKVIGSMFGSRKASSYINFLTLFSDIDPKGGRSIITRHLLQALSDEYDSTAEHPGVNPILAKHRRALSSGMMHVITNPDVPAIRKRLGLEGKSQVTDNLITDEALESAEDLLAKEGFERYKSFYRHTIPGCMTAISLRAVFVRGLVNSLGIGEELIFDFVFRDLYSKISIKGMPEYFVANTPANNSLGLQYFSQVNELILRNIRDQLEYQVFDIDKVRKLLQTIQDEIDSFSSGEPNF